MKQNAKSAIFTCENGKRLLRQLLLLLPAWIVLALGIAMCVFSGRIFEQTVANTRNRLLLSGLFYGRHFLSVISLPVPEHFHFGSTPTRIARAKSRASQFLRFRSHDALFAGSQA